MMEGGSSTGMSTSRATRDSGVCCSVGRGMEVGENIRIISVMDCLEDVEGLGMGFSLMVSTLFSHDDDDESFSLVCRRWLTFWPTR